MAKNSANAVSSTAGGAAAGASVGGPWGAVAGGALGLAGSIFGANSAKSASSASNKAALLSTLMQINWEKQRAQNAHQWEVADLHAAGLNPILSAGGQGANTGGISPAMPDTSGLKSAGEIMSKGLENIIPMASSIYSQLKGTENQTTQTEANKRLADAQTWKTIEEAKTTPREKKALINKMKAETSRTNEERNPANAVGANLNKLIKEAQIKRKKSTEYKSAKSYKEKHKNDNYIKKLTAFKIH